MDRISDRVNRESGIETLYSTTQYETHEGHWLIPLFPSVPCLGLYKVIRSDKYSNPHVYSVLCIRYSFIYWWNSGAGNPILLSHILLISQGPLPIDYKALFRACLAKSHPTVTQSTAHAMRQTASGILSLKERHPHAQAIGFRRQPTNCRGVRCKLQHTTEYQVSNHVAQWGYPG